MMMSDFLSLILQNKTAPQQKGRDQGFTWQWLGEGVLALTPDQGYDKAVVISVGIHGNETAPIELLDKIVTDLFSGQIPLTVRLLLVLGNPEAIRQGVRYVEGDLNRMFLEGWTSFESSNETARVQQLQQSVTEFFEASDTQAVRYHYDLHTAIRASLLPTFGLLPQTEHGFDDDFLQSLDASELDAIVHHQTMGKTFTQFTTTALHASSCTLELGKALAFGQNDLQQFQAIDCVLRRVISNQSLLIRQKSALRHFKVEYSLLKQSDDFQLFVADDVPNFTEFEQGMLLCTQQHVETRVQHQREWILFPNPKVKTGLRAGLMLTEMTASS